MSIEKESPSINASSMADIAFLLLVFFLVTTTMESDWGLARILPPDIEGPITEVIDRNVMEVKVNSEDELLVEGKVVEIGELREIAREFILNPKDDENLPQKYTKDIPNLGPRVVIRHVISLQNDNRTSYQCYIQVQDELAKAYRDARDTYAMREFGNNYQDLVDKGDRNKVMAIRKICPMRISEANPYQAQLNPIGP